MSTLSRAKLTNGKGFSPTIRQPRWRCWVSSFVRKTIFCLEYARYLGGERCASRRNVGDVVAMRDRCGGNISLGSSVYFSVMPLKQEE
jgi:hypothetical protein